MEEVAFILLLVLMVLTLHKLLICLSLPLGLQRLANGLWWVILVIIGWYGLQATHLASLPGRDHPTYLTYLMEWSLPILMLQWLIGRQPIWYARQSLAMLVLGVAGWFTLADALALYAGIWSLATRDVMGLYLGNVPIEETLFFGIVTLLVAQTSIILTSWHASQRSLTLGAQWHPLLRRILSDTAHATGIKPDRYGGHLFVRRNAS
ncbi:MAG: lycopene cyclase domain-containing protein [Ktedonobacterales bacterium]|nr:lycopene cyclase domain-containing protein [Ktedonobacterales bacterium]